MSLSYEITHVSSNSTESVDVIIADKTTMVLMSSDVDQKTGRVTSTYVLATGDINHPAYITYTIDPVDPSKKNRYGSASLDTWVTQTDSVTGLITWWPIKATTSFVVANGAPVQLADFDKLISCMYSYTYLSVTSGSRDTTWLQDLLFGNPAVK